MSTPRTEKRCGRNTSLSLFTGLREACKLLLDGLGQRGVGTKLLLKLLIELPGLRGLSAAVSVTQPAQARQLYQQLEKQFGSDATLAQAIKQQLASLP